MMAMPDYVLEKRLEELWKQIQKSHFSYLYTDDSPEKLKERQKLEGYILDYLCIIPHQYKFTFPETLSLMTRSALDHDFNGYRLARGWAALARYASNLLAQPWRKEYRTIRLYSGFYKHEVEGSGLIKVEEILRVMGYKREVSPHSLTLDGPVCPTQVTGISLDSLIAYVECQIMIQIWEEVSRRGGSCSWLEILKCREAYAGNVDRATTLILQTQRNPLTADIPCSDIYSNVNVSLQQNVKKYLPYQSSTDMPDHLLPTTICNNSMPHIPHMQNYDQHYVQPNTNGYIQNGHVGNTNNMVHMKAAMHPNDQNMQNMHISNMNNMANEHGMYCMNPTMMNQMNPMYRYPAPNMMNPYNPMGGFMYQPMPTHPYIIPAPLPTYGPVRHATTLPLTNGYHCPTVPPQAYCPTVPTGQLIELDIPSYSINNLTSTVTSPKQNYAQDKIKTDSNFKSHADATHKKSHANAADLMCLSNSIHIKKVNDSSSDNQESLRRNSAPKSSGSYSSDHTFSIPRSDTQPSLSKAREDGMGTFESWDYVFRNLENQGYSKDLGDRDNQIPSPLESKTLGRTTMRDPKRYQQTTMDLEDALHAMSLEKDTDEEMYRTAKINETLMKLKQENEAKAAKANMKKQIRADEREKRKTHSYETNSATLVSENNAYNKHIVNDKARLISKEDAKDKKEMDKSVLVNGNNNKVIDSRKIKKSVVKCLSSEADSINGKKKSSPEQAAQNATIAKKAASYQVPTNSNHQTSSHPNTSKSSQDTVDAAMKSRLVVTLHSPEKPNTNKSPSSSHGGVRNGEHSSKNGVEHKEQSNTKSKMGMWECGTCTYVNHPSRNVCEICGKSQQVGVEALPLMSGGKECPACTLVNNRDATVCAVCEASLKHSPTYI